MIFIGVGNENRGDDAAGLYFARELKHANKELSVHEITDDTIRLVDLLSPDEEVVIVDAMKSGSPPGTVKKFGSESINSMQIGMGYSTHTLPLPDVVLLAELTGNAPAKWTIYGIEGRCFDPASKLSVEVCEAVDRLVQLYARTDKKRVSAVPAGKF